MPMKNAWTYPLMPKALLRDITDTKQQLSHLFRQQHCQWLAGKGKWPLVLSLGIPDQKTAINNLQAVNRWINTWQKWQGPGHLQWCVRDWPLLGRQQLPEKIIFSEVNEIVKWIGEEAFWQQLCARFKLLVQHWPPLSKNIKYYYEALAAYSDLDFIHLQKALEWLIAHPDSGKYIRQLPLQNIDTKWMESRKTIIGQMLGLIKNSDDFLLHDFYMKTGLKPWPNLIRMRVLDNNLRAKLSGLSDICASVEDIAQLNLPVKRVYIVENICTGLAFSDIPDAVVFMGLGYGVSQLDPVNWIKSTPCYYWGDLDTHGFAILNALRGYLPHLKSLLMDEKTLLKSKPLWTKEPKPYRTACLDYLTKDEHILYTNLRDNRWGHHIRLEQERILWSDAWDIINYALF